MLRQYKRKENERRNQTFWKYSGIYNVKAMKTYYVSCKKDTANKNSSVTRTKKKNTVNKNSSLRRTKQNKLILVSNCAVCCKKKSKLLRNLETSRLKLYQVVFKDCFVLFSIKLI